MAITIEVEPFDFSPAYNPLRFEVDSNNKNQAGFKYVFDVYQSGTSNKIGEYKVYPRYPDGFGEIDLSKLLQNKVSFNFTPTNTSSYNPSNSFYKYDIKFGEEYIVTRTYVAALTNNSGNVQITFSTSHTFVAGDQVVITQNDGGVANPLMEGLFTVISVTSTQITINALWANVTNANIDGTVKYADNRKSTFRDLITSPNKFVFNGAQSFRAFRTYDEATYLLNSTNDLFLTSQPLTNFYCTREQDIWVNMGNNFDNTSFVYFQNSASSIFRKAITNNNIMTQVAVGPGNYGTLTLVSGTSTTLTDPGITWYRYWFANAAGTVRSKLYRIDLDERCAIEDYEIVFLDRMGSFSSFAFQLRAYERGNTKRDTYNKHIVGDTSSDIWRYSSFDRGMTVMNPTVERTLELNTNWMTEEMSVYFEELITSPVTYLKDTDGLYYAVLINDTSFEINRSRNKTLFKKTITIKYANENIING